MKKVELLAPAGDMASLKLAIEAGADAIYLGGKKYSARAYSKNFDDDEIIKAISYAHLYGVKVYVTLNTIIYENEVNEFINYVEFLHKNNVDAILLQDLGMLDLIRKTFPNLEVHSSTQMHIHNLAGAKLMQDLGVKRIVLARETPIKEIKNIKNNTNIEIEVFVHGALCISYSGQCLMSYFNGKRSANRGECAGCCRLKYDVFDLDNNKLNIDNPYPLSTKDLYSLENLSTLIDSGVSSLKIEGRMKSPSYVYLVTRLYRQAIDSYYKNKEVIINKKILHDLKIIFNRKYTKGYLFNEKDLNLINMKNSNHQGLEIGQVISCKNNNIKIKLSDDVYINDALRILSKSDDAIILSNFYINKKLVKEAHKGDIISLTSHKKIDIGSIVLKTSSKKIVDDINEDIKQHPRKVLVTATINAKVGEELKISVTDGKNSVKESSIVLEKSINNPTTKEVLLEKINKLNDTIYEINSIKINIDDNVFVPMKVFNDLRRDVFNKLSEKRLYNTPYLKQEYNITLPDFSVEKNTNVLVNNYVNNNILRLPRIVSNYDNYDINNNYLATEIGALYSLKNIDTDFSFNVVNSYSVAFLHSLGVNKITLSYELSYDQIKEIINNYENRYHKHPNLEVITSSNVEVMVTKFNLCKYYNKNNLLLKGNNTYILKDNDTYMSIYIKDKYVDNNNYFAIGINNIRENKEI